MAPHQNQYVIDANILINFSIFAPPSTHKTFWMNMEEAVNTDKIIIIRDVADECKYGFINAWVEQFEATGKIINVNDKVKQRSLNINNTFKMITQVNNSSGQSISKSEADPVIIAYAEANKYIVFTREGEQWVGLNKPLTSSHKQTMKIPAVCRELKVKLERSPENVLPNIMSVI